VALLAMAAGFGQFGAVAALGDVAKTFGHLARHGSGSTLTLAQQAGLSGTTIGVGLAILRLASFGALFLSSLADRFGRRRAILSSCIAGLALTVIAAGSPSYWWFVAIFAAGRPLLSTTTALASVTAAEQTASSDRAKAVALVAAGYGLGAGLTALIHSLAASELGFRGIFALAVVPLVLVPRLAHRVQEPARFQKVAASHLTEHSLPVLSAVARPFRRRLAIVAGLAFAVAVVSGPANSFLFLYAQNVLRLSGGVTASMVTAAGVAGFGGLLLGRRLADTIGRRPTAAGAMALMAAIGVVTYSGSRPAAVIGYIAGIFAASVFAPAAGALANELFPTSVRATVAGWQAAASVLGAVAGLLAFGAIADVGHRFGTAAAATFLPTLVLIGLFLLLPETRGHEPEQLWAEP
jgi:MFS family permease